MRIGRLSALGLFVVAACSGGGGGGGSRGPTSPPPGIQYSSAGSTAANSVVLAEGAGSTATTLRLEVRAQSFTELFGTGFDVLYPSNVLSFASATEGTFLGGTTTSFQVKESSPGRLVFGVTRLGSAGGVSGTGVLATLVFNSIGVSGSGTFSFDENKAFTTGRSVAEEIDGVVRVGGAVTVVP